MEGRLCRRVVTWIAVFIGAVPLFVQAQDIGLSGRIYVDYTYHFEDSFNAFQMKRVYLGYEGQLAPSVDFVVTSDVDVASSSSNSRMFMKYAYARWQNRYSTVIIGMLPINAYDIQKKTWGLRYLYKTVMNEYGFAPSADIGVSYKRQFSESFSVSTIVANGPGYKTSENNKYKRLHIRLLYGPDNLGKTEGFNAGIYGSWEPDKVVNYGNIFTVAGFVGIHQSDLWAGLEAAVQDDNVMNIRTTLISGYGRFAFSPEIQGFLRLDARTFDTANSQDETALIGGVQYVKYRGISLSPNIIYNRIGDDGVVIGRFNCEFRW